MDLGTSGPIMTRAATSTSVPGGPIMTSPPTSTSMPGALPFFSASKPEFTAAIPPALRGKINIGLEKMLLDDLKDSTNLQIRHELRMLRQILEAEKRKLRSLPPHPTGSVVRHLDYAVAPPSSFPGSFPMSTEHKWSETHHVKPH